MHHSVSQTTQTSKRCRGIQITQQGANAWSSQGGDLGGIAGEHQDAPSRAQKRQKPLAHVTTTHHQKARFSKDCGLCTQRSLI